MPANANGEAVSFDVPDDIFDEPGEGNIGDTTVEGPSLLDEINEEPPEEPKIKAKEEPPEEPEEPPEEPEEPEFEAPPSDEPAGDGYLLAQARQQLAEMELQRQRMAEQLNSMNNPANAEAQADQSLVEKRTAMRERAMRAIQAGDDTEHQSAMWQLQDLDQEIADRRSQRAIRELQAQSSPQQVQDNRLLSQQQSLELENQTFRELNRVTPEEELKMGTAYKELVDHDARWAAPDKRRWSVLEATLRRVRKSARGPGRMAQPQGASMVEGGGRAAAKSSKAAQRHDRRSLAAAAASFEMSPADYAKFLDSRRSK